MPDDSYYVISQQDDASISIYGISIRTNYNGVVAIEFRNSSNGYYGGLVEEYSVEDFERCYKDNPVKWHSITEDFTADSR